MSGAWIPIFDKLAPPISDQPMVHLLQWRIVQIEELHLVGVVHETGGVRTTSPVVSMTKYRTVVTSSGRLYQLLGGPGDPEILLFCPTLHAVRWTDRTEEVVELFDPIQ